MDHPRVVRGRLRPLSGVLRLRRRPVRNGPRDLQPPARRGRRGGVPVPRRRAACSGSAGRISTPTRTKVGPLPSARRGARGPARADPGHDHRPRLQRALRGCPPGIRRRPPACGGRCRRRAPGPRAAGGERRGRSTPRGSPKPRPRPSPTTSWPGEPGPTRSSRSRWHRPAATTGSSPSTRAAASSRSLSQTTLADLRPVGGGRAGHRGRHRRGPTPGQHGPGAVRAVHVADRDRQHPGDGREGGAGRARRHRLRSCRRLLGRRGTVWQTGDKGFRLAGSTGYSDEEVARIELADVQHGPARPRSSNKGSSTVALARTRECRPRCRPRSWSPARPSDPSWPA